ncbi:MAG: hypothetical protein C0524_01460 [Rhodobacter sp.]|nr:hypothetical protein [Rhodobacter sp.]
MPAFGLPAKDVAMEPIIPLPIALSACTDPMLSAEMAVSVTDVTVSPTLSVTLGGATVSVAPN